MAFMGGLWSGGAGMGMGSTIATVMFLYAMFQRYFPYLLKEHIERYTHRLISRFNPYIEVTIYEDTGERLKRNEVYTVIKNYLSINSSKQAKRLKADIGMNSNTLTLSMDNFEEITDEYEGVQFWWSSREASSRNQSISFNPATGRYYKLTFHKKHRGLVTDSYLSHVLEVGKAIGLQSRQRKLYTNNPSSEWYRYNGSVWSHVFFDHPSNFRTLAMDAEKKRDIIDDLTTFSKGKDFYAEVGKAWKRGYLLYGPPGTGKSTMIAAMANFLNYDIYDLELTGVKNNSELRKLLIETSNKSLIVIEDIDCSLDLTGQRKKKKAKEEGEEEEEEEVVAVAENPIPKKTKESVKNEESKVTLSGLLNFIDGIWSACGGERIIVFTTNYVDKLDPALIRRGRMDKHIEMSYCSFGAFEVLARNYLKIESHHLFETIQELLGETEITPADVAENLMPKITTGDIADVCLENVIQAIKDKKEDARLKAERRAKRHEAATKDKAIADESPTRNEAKKND